MRSCQDPVPTKYPLRKPPNAWLLYQSDMGAALFHADPTQKVRRNRSKIIGKMWNEESIEVRGIYARKAELLRRAHRELRPDQNYDSNGKAGIDRKRRVAAINKAGRAVPYILPSRVDAFSPSGDGSGVMASDQIQSTSSILENTLDTNAVDPPSRLILRLPPGGYSLSTLVNAHPIQPHSSASDDPETINVLGISTHRQLMNSATASIREVIATQVNDRSSDIEEIPAETVQAVREWCRNYLWATDMQAPGIQNHALAQTSFELTPSTTESLFGTNPECGVLDHALPITRVATPRQFPVPAPQQSEDRSAETLHSIPSHPHLWNETSFQSKPPFDQEATVAELGVPPSSMDDFDFESFLRNIDVDSFSRDISGDGAAGNGGERINKGPTAQPDWGDLSAFNWV